MSSPDRQLVLSPRAQDDYAEILQQTLETWGEDQLLVYSKVLSDGLEVILDNPLIGFARPAVSEQHRFFR
jgi:toxin ParE1/3/4